MSTYNPDDYLTREDILILATRELIDLGEWPYKTKQILEG